MSKKAGMQEAVNTDKKQTGKATFKKLVCPFDLDAIFSLQFSTQGLKSVLEFIFEHMGTMDEN
jgi:hypothetical protein